MKSQPSFLFLPPIDNQNLSIAKNQLWIILEPQIAYLKREDQDFVHLAFEVMVEKHANQRRKNNDFYIIHPVAACQILAEIKLDKEALAACLLHDVPEDTYENPQDGIKMIQTEFGPEVAFLVSGITKLSLLKYQGKDRFAENLRRMFVAMSKDLRVIFIKLADRVHNLQTLKAISENAQRPDKAKRIALESLEIYAPIADRLGMGLFRGLIEDYAFPFAYPAEYKQFINVSELEIIHRSKQVKKLVNKTKAILSKEKVNYKEVFGRAKKYYSIYRKMLENKKSLEQIHDLIALRVITNSVEDCYQVLSILHSNFEFNPERIKDYIREPKSNGYKSIHTTVSDKQTGLTFEFQIRTQEMHEYAEYGVAAHWNYKQKNKLETSKFLNQENLQWISNLIDLGNKEISTEDYIKQVRLNLFSDRIFVFTPAGDPINLPAGSTALDFAFRIHSEIGIHAMMAKVNGKITPLDFKLFNGDVVEITTSKNQVPRIDWLRWVKSSSSSRTIRNFLRKTGLSFPSNSKKDKYN